MNYTEYINELYKAFDRIKNANWYDNIVEDIETIMWYAGLSDKFKKTSPDGWSELLKTAYDILKIY